MITANQMNDKDAQAFRDLRILLGWVENGTNQTVEISQDDATKSWCVTVKSGKYTSTHNGESLQDVLTDASETETEREITWNI